MLRITANAMHQKCHDLERENEMIGTTEIIKRANIRYTEVLKLYNERIEDYKSLKEDVQ